MERMEHVQGGTIGAATPGVHGARDEHTGAALRLRPHQVACRAAPVPPVRRGQRAQPPRGREGPHQSFRLPQREVLLGGGVHDQIGGYDGKMPSESRTSTERVIIHTSPPPASK